MNMLSVKEATERVLSVPVKKKTERVLILDSLYCIAAEDIISRDYIPACDNSAVDGYALRTADLSGAEKDHPAILRLLKDDIPAGRTTGFTIEPGVCIKIMTGAPVPIGSDCIVKKEDVLSKADKILVFNEHKKGENIRLTGEDIRKGDVVIKKGKKIYPADIGVLASVGRSRILLNKKPVTGIVITGDEIIEINNKLKPGKVRDSNSYSLAAQVIETGALFKQYGIIKDEKALIRDNIITALSECEIVLLTGGVSVGDYDYVKEVLESIGVKFVFTGVKQKPGKPVTFSTYRDRFIFGLPGNPVAAMVCFEIYVRPLIKKIIGENVLFRNKIVAKASENYLHKSGRTEFIRVRLFCRDKNFYFSATGTQGSGVLMSMADADGLAIFPESCGNIAKDTELEVILLKACN